MLKEENFQANMKIIFSKDTLNTNRGKTSKIENIPTGKDSNNL